MIMRMALALTVSLAAAGPVAAQSNPLRIAMTLADIPLADGAPDQGTEHIRFMGYTLYDPLIMWDLSSADKPARLVPELDRLVAAACNEPDSEKLDARMIDQACFVWIVHDVWPTALSARVKGFVHPKSWYVDFSPVTVE